MIINRDAIQESITGLRRVADAFDAKGMPAGASANRHLAGQTEDLLAEIDRLDDLLDDVKALTALPPHEAREFAREVRRAAFGVPASTTGSDQP